MHQNLLNCSYRTSSHNMDYLHLLSLTEDLSSPPTSFARFVIWLVFNKRCLQLSTLRLIVKQKGSIKSWNNTSESIVTINKMTGSLISLSLASLTTIQNTLQLRLLLSLPTMATTLAVLSSYNLLSIPDLQKRGFATFACFMTI
jgi:hypothetical protein